MFWLSCAIMLVLRRKAFTRVLLKVHKQTGSTFNRGFVCSFQQFAPQLDGAADQQLRMQMP
jgi:hypothetical protein